MKIAQLDKEFTPTLKLDDKHGADLKPSSNDKQPGFMDYLMGALGQVDNLQKEAATSAEKVALGDQSYLHNTVIAAEKAYLALQLTMEVRNKIVEAYQEVMRIQM